MKNVLSAVIFSIFLFSGYLLAQETNVTTQATDPNLQSNPAKKDKLFFITEFGVVHSFSRNSEANQASWELGVLKGLNNRYAAGGTWFISHEQTGWRNILIGIKPRFRIAMNSRFSLDIAPGILFAGRSTDQTNTYNNRFPAFTGHISLNYRNWFLLYLQHERFPFANPFTNSLYQSEVSNRFDRQQKSPWSIGLKLGSTPGLLGGPLAAILIIAANMLFRY
ncbi:MAG: hypothetical protein DWQ05_17450 [Calditrichaeota bacterium]|nr:MAG: hypothetical protein DWQ05_17450 [Calditrichota bacterium]